MPSCIFLQRSPIGPLNSQVRSKSWTQFTSAASKRQLKRCNTLFSLPAGQGTSCRASTTTAQTSRLLGLLLAGVYAGSCLFTPPSVAEEVKRSQTEEGLTIKFKASRDPAIRAAQEALVQSWGYASTQFLDPKLNGLNWPKELQDSLDASFSATSPSDVYEQANIMLGKLDDPFTRVIPPDTEGAFENALEGQVVGVGIQVGLDEEGNCRISFVATGSPAERAGVQIGDVLTTVNGRSVRDLKKEELAALLRTQADIGLQRPGKEEEADASSLDLTLVAEPIEVHPVQYAVLQSDEAKGKVGYIRLIAFSKNAAQDMENALKDLQEEQVESIVLDLRDNVGGVVLSGYQVAQLLLPLGASFCTVEDGRGASEEVRMAESHQLTSKPLVVMMNGGSASTAELLAASLHDNQRATLLGEKSFGKGRTQRVIPLKGNALLLLSNTTYLTPQHQVVDKVGLTPDIACKPEFTETSFWQSGSQSSASLLEDPCIRKALDTLQSA